MTETGYERIIAPPSRWAPLELGEVWRFRGLLASFAMRDLRLRYRQTALGVVWVVIQPMLSAGIFSFVFGRVANLSSGGVPYFVFAYVGMMAWTVFASTLTKFSTSLVSNAQLISKNYFPRLVLPLSSLGSTGVDLAVALAMGVVVLAVGGVAPGLGILTLPFWILVLVLLSSGVGLLAAALMVQYRDVGYILPVATQLMLYATPIAYDLSVVPESARWLVQLNPVAGAVDGFRWALTDSGAPSIGLVVYTTLASVACLVIGSTVFTRMERKFADVI